MNKARIHKKEGRTGGIDVQNRGLRGHKDGWVSVHLSRRAGKDKQPLLLIE